MIPPRDVAPIALWSDRKIMAVLFGGVLLVYMAVIRGRIEIYDSQSMLAVTKNLVDHGSLRTTGAGYQLHQVWAPYGIAMSILAVPAYLISLWTAHFNIVVSLVSPLLTAFCVQLIYRIVRALDWSALHAAIAAIGYGVLSMALWYSTEPLSEPGATLCVLAIILSLIRWRQGSATAPLWLGIAAGVAVQFRPDSLFTVWVGLLAIPLFVPLSVFLSRRSLTLLLLPMALSLGFFFWYNDLRYGRIFLTTDLPNGGYRTALLHGLDGLLISPGKGIFIYNPLTVMGVAGLILLFVGRRNVRDRALGTLCFFLIVPRVILFAKFDFWWGGNVWGPRYLLPMVAILFVLIIPVLRATNPRKLSGWTVRITLGLLAVLGATINYLSVRVPVGEWLGLLNNPVWRSRLGIHGLQTGVEQNNAADFHFTTSPIWGVVRLLERHIAVANGDWWIYGHGAVGYLLLVLGALCLVGAACGALPGHKPPETVSASRDFTNPGLAEVSAGRSGP
jgi:hypothetical protein